MVNKNSSGSFGKIKQFIAFGICSLVALALCITILVVTVNNLNGAGGKETKETVESLTELSADKAELIEYVSRLTKDAKENVFVKSCTYTDVSVDDEITVSGKNADKDRQLFAYVKNKILPTVDGYYREDTIGTFRNKDSIKPVFNVNKELITKADFSVGLADEEGNPVYDTDSGELIDSEFYYVTFVADGSDAARNKAFAETFSFENDKNIGERFKKDVSDSCKVSDTSVTPDDFVIEFKINRLNDNIVYINVIRNYIISSTVSFINELEVFGTKNVDFKYTVKETYDYLYSGISFAQREINLEIGAEQALTVNAVIDDDSEYSVKFTSSNQECVTVDEMGYIKAEQLTGSPVTVTVTLEYLGEKFTDECIVNVSKKGGASNE